MFIHHLHNNQIPKDIIIQKVPYMFLPYSAIFREVFGKEKHNIG